jgi:outer membrane receptor protein involved in Fe transport
MKSFVILNFPRREVLKFIIMVKLIWVLVLSSALQVVAGNTKSYSQTTKLNLHLKNSTLENIIWTIKKQTEFNFFYNTDDIKGVKRIDVEMDNATVEEILDKILHGTGLSFEIVHKTIILRKDSVKIPNEEPEKKKINRIQPENETGTLRGSIKDEKGLPLVGATIIVNNTLIGTISDDNGNFTLQGVPVGLQLIKITFIGFEEVISEIEITKEITVLNIQMKLSSQEISGIDVYGQARGQLSAINKQLNAKGITNVVSAEKMQELPDVNIAEAIGRLPGLMVERNRGEGQKIIIRGLQPKYNTISIGGNIAPSTSTEDRSTDLNMISPEILGGVEVLKANTADRDAEGLGGTVNLTIRQAPSGLKVTSNILAGYSGHTSSWSNYKANIYASNRFFNEKLGIMLTGNLESAERNSDVFNVDFTVLGTPNYESGETFVKPWISFANLQANIENRTRTGGSLLFDWEIGSSTTIKSSNFVGYLDRKIFDREKKYDVVQNYLNVNQYHRNISQLLYSNSIDAQHLILGSVLDWGVSRSQSINDNPFSHEINFRKLDAFKGYAQGRSFDIEPPELVPYPDNVKDTLDQYYLYNGNNRPYQAKEVETGGFVNLEIPYKLGTKILGNIKVGTKIRIKDRHRENHRFHSRFDSPSAVNDLLQFFPDYLLTAKGNIGKISLLNFLDENFQKGDFLNNDFQYLQMNHVIDRSKMSKLYDDFLQDYYDKIPSAAKDDYETFESIFAFYAMSELKIGKFISFIPGVRYEKTDIRYESYIAEEFPASETNPIDVPFRDTTATNSYSHLLPQIHLKIKPTNWFDIRLAYTNTLSRPDYNQLAPKK